MFLSTRGDMACHPPPTSQRCCCLLDDPRDRHIILRISTSRVPQTTFWQLPCHRVVSLPSLFLLERMQEKGWVEHHGSLGVLTVVNFGWGIESRLDFLLSSLHSHNVHGVDLPY